MLLRMTALAGLLGGLLVASGCAQAAPVVKGIKARVLSADLNGVALAFDVDVENRLPIALKSSGGRYGLDVDGNPFLSWDKVPALNLEANKVGTVTLPARVDFAGLIKSFQALASAKEIPYRMHGAFVFSPSGQEFEVPFAHEGKMPGPGDMLRGGTNLLGLP